MVTYLLDTGVLISRPEVTLRPLANAALVTHRLVVDEIQALASAGVVPTQVVTLIDRAVSQGILVVDATDLSFLRGELPTSPRRTFDATVLVNLAGIRAATEPVITVVSDDPTVRSAASAHRVTVISSTDLLAALPAQADGNAEIATLVAAIQATQNQYLWKNLGAFVLVAAFAVAVYANLAWLSGHANAFLVVLLISGLGIGLFALRARFRLAYGLGECTVGVILGWQVYSGLGTSSALPLSAAPYLQFLAGLYVVVRGLDNVGKAPTKTKYYPFWDRWFPN